MAEIPRGETEQNANDLEITDILRDALRFMKRPIEWESKNNSATYRAEPIPVDVNEDIPYDQIDTMPLWQFHELTEAWCITSHQLNFERDTIIVSRYFVCPIGTLATSTEESVALIDPRVDSTFLKNSVKDELQRQLQSRQMADMRDYANIHNGLHDLHPVLKEELRTIRSLKRGWIIEPEMSKVSAPKWWGVTIYNAGFLVKASSAEEAVLDVEDHLEYTDEPSMFPMVHAHEDELQPQLEAKFGERKLMRMIPFSMEEWPDDPNNMTQEQKMAFDRLRPTDDTSSHEPEQGTLF
jgi:hypothetical protein